MAGTDLQTLALQVLAKAEEILATTSNGPPAFAYVTHGPPVLDCCNQLAVNVAAIGQEASVAVEPGQAAKIGRINLTTMNVTQTRCWPAGLTPTRPPWTSEQQAAAAGLNEDGWALWCGLYWAVRTGALMQACDHVFFDGLVPIEPQGGCVGWLISIRFELGGYNPLGGS